MPVIKKCEKCSKQFSVKPCKSHVRFCSKQCWYESRKVEITCETCGTKFLTNKARADSKYCSQECTHEAQKDRALRKCINCGKEEIVQKAYSSRPFCSASCSTTYHILNNKVGYYRTKHGERNDIEGVCFRSGWEANYARVLNLENIEWEFEQHQFKLLNGTIYTPDFYLPETNEFIEVKGYWTEYSAKKFKMFKEEYPEVKMTVIDSPKYKELEKQYKDKIANWE